MIPFVAAAHTARRRPSARTDEEAPVSKYQDLCKALDDARATFSGYRSECVLFAASLARGFVEYSGWPRELVAYETSYESIAGPGGPSVTQKPEEAMWLGDDGFWHLRMRLSLQAKDKDLIRLEVRLKRLETRYIVSLFGSDASPGEDYEVTAPTSDDLQQVYDQILSAIRRHYEYGLRLFLENGGRGLKIPISATRLVDMSAGKGSGSA
jgi:hypothetical protein